MTAPHLFLSLLSFSVAIAGATTVTNNADSGSGSLRAAIASAINGETITFDSSLNGATIVLTSDHLLITSLQVTIDASSLAGGISLSGNNLNRILHVTGATSNVTLRNLQIREGRANTTSVNGNGGGILLAAGNLTLTNCTIRNCFATGNGGALFLSIGVTSTFERCAIVGNSAGSVGLGGGIAVSEASTSLFQSCVISGNAALSGAGGGLAIANSSPSFINCTIQGNSGGGLRLEYDSNPTIKNTIIWGNRGTTGSTAVQQIKNLGTKSPAVSYSLLEGTSGSGSFPDGNTVVWGAGNLDGTLVANTPKFATEIAAGSAPHSGGDLRLLQGSPALNQGDNLAGIGSLDLAGSARIQDSIVDLGAYEGYYVTFSSLYPSLTPAADDNHNGVSNFQEYAMGFNPSSTTNPQVGPALSFASGNTFLTVNQRPNGLDFTPHLATSTSLVSWTEMMEGIHYAVESTTTASSDRKVLTLRLLNTADPKRFYRQGVTTSN